MKLTWLLKNYLIYGLFLSSCSGQGIPAFDETAAFRHLEKQCAFGPRVPGSASHLQCRDFLVAELKKYASQVTLQPFQVTLEKGTPVVTAYNIIANFHVDKKQRLLLCAHWDTRPWADRDPQPSNHKRPVPGANDGASGVAVLLEVARIISLSAPKYGVDIVLFDAEDLGSYGQNDTWALGSRQFAQNLVRSYHPEMGILIDMIGDADQQIYIEQHSNKYAPQVVKRVWSAAQQLGITEFIPQVGPEVYDDHLSLLEVGIPCIDLIDFDYPYWHTIADTPDKCSPRSLGNIGRVLLALLYE
ncbi:MAG: M28 family peptidase [candidate division KSB1 bacterium]|nr:M28 family peptidase [candidate division KSB1 bacterium]MDZ7341811.1 M28 family peptidase [candidate division KSB1 bacterium]